MFLTEICLRRPILEGNNMGNYCTNCGTELRKDDNYCINCGTKIIKEDVYCTSCGTELRKDYNYCINCGTKIDKSNTNQNNHSKSTSTSAEKEKARKELEKVIGGRLMYNDAFRKKLLENGLDTYNTGKAIRQQVETEIITGKVKSREVESRVDQLIAEHKIQKEKEEKKKLKMIDEIFESEEIKSEIRKNNIDQTDVISIKNSLKDKIINKREKMIEGEIKYFIKSALKSMKTIPIKEKEVGSARIQEPEIINGGYCSLNCRHCYEELFDSGGGIVGDLDDDGYIEYYCHLGHQISLGSFCEDYE